MITNTTTTTNPINAANATTNIALATGERKRGTGGCSTYLGLRRTGPRNMIHVFQHTKHPSGAAALAELVVRGLGQLAQHVAQGARGGGPV